MDRTEYQTGETLNIEARNGLAASIWILDAERGGRNPWWGLQRREEDEWKELDVWKPTDDECRIIVSEQVPLEELVREIEPGATRSDRWNFVNCVQLSPVGPKVEREPLQAGVYRLFLRYGSDKSSWKSNKVYSGEFSVGGK